MIRETKDPRRWRRAGVAVATAVVAVAAVVTFASPAGAIPPDDDFPPTDSSCLERTVVNSLSVNRPSTLGSTSLDTVTFSWNISRGCPGLRLSVDGVSVSDAGSRQVKVPLSRRLTVRGSIVGSGSSATWYGPFVMAGRFIRYPVRSNGTLGAGQPQAASGDAVTDAAARRVVESVRSPYREHFAGKRIEIHLLPRGHRFSELPPWDESPSSNDAFGLGSSNEDAVHDANGWWGPGPDVHSVGITVGGGAHVVTHELGHAVLLHAGSALSNEVALAWVAHGWCPGGEGCSPTAPEPKWIGCLGGDDYGGTNPHEYWAEGAAALLMNQPGPCPPVVISPQPDPNQYTRQYLAANDPGLDRLLRRVFAV
jgi:hypothetical protein